MILLYQQVNNLSTFERLAYAYRQEERERLHDMCWMEGAIRKIKINRRYERDTLCFSKELSVIEVLGWKWINVNFQFRLGDWSNRFEEVIR